MKADSFFCAGLTHKVCQDYAAAGEVGKTFRPAGVPNTPAAYAIVSDGCSDSPDTDFGSRLLVRHAMGQVRRHGGRLDPDSLIENAAEVGRRLNLDPRAMNATIAIAFEEGNEVGVKLWGDGVIAARGRDGSLVIHSVVFPTGAPMYLNYWLSESNLTAYLQKFGPTRVTTSIRILPDGTVTATEDEDSAINIENDNEPVSVDFRFSRYDYDIVAVMSDGVQSFKAFEGRGYVGLPIETVVAAMMNFKVLTGEFVVRRLKAFFRKAEELGWRWDDDVSMAAIYTGDLGETP